MKFFVPHPLVACLEAVENRFGEDPKNIHWEMLDMNQRDLVVGEFATRNDLKFFSENELKVFVDKSSRKLNAALKNEESEMRFKEIGSKIIGSTSNEIGTAAIMKLVFKWFPEDMVTKSPMLVGKKRYDVLTFNSGFSLIKAFSSNRPIIKLRAMGGYEVFIMPYDKDDHPTDGFGIRRKLEGIMTYAREGSSDISCLRLPAISIKTEVDTDWANGMIFRRKGKPDVVVEQIKEEVHLELNEETVKIESMSAMSMRSCGITVNEPFYIMIKNERVRKGILYGFINQGGWVES